ncbi:hypothetical protein H5976_08645, partial [Streptococcus alactolyticus]|uniref:hypothetical protein n=1 Tax=Streptococcus alactolyticus TaxID=29389 RepID=UPI00195E62E1
VKKGPGGAPIKQTLSNSANYILLNKGQLDALTALRFRTYGLVNMDEDKVKSLVEVEAATLASVRFNKKEVSFIDDAERILELVKA